MATKTIRHALFEYRTGDGARRVAFRGDTVDITRKEDLERGEKHGAFEGATTATAGATPAEGEPLADWGPLTDEERKSWVTSATVDEVLGYATAHPEHATSIRDVEAARGDRARKTLLDGLDKLTAPAGGTGTPLVGTDSNGNPVPIGTTPAT